MEHTAALATSELSGIDDDIDDFSSDEDDYLEPVAQGDPAQPCSYRNGTRGCTAMQSAGVVSPFTHACV
jgi:hypothetical protein